MVRKIDWSTDRLRVDISQKLETFPLYWQLPIVDISKSEMRKIKEKRKMKYDQESPLDIC